MTRNRFADAALVDTLMAQTGHTHDESKELWNGCRGCEIVRTKRNHVYLVAVPGC